MSEFRKKWFKHSADHNRKIVFTGKRSKKSNKINDRCERIHNKSYADAIGTMYLEKGEWKEYKRADYQYDVKHGYIQHAMLCRHDSTPEEMYHASLETQEWYESAMLTSEGGDPLNRKAAKASGIWDLWHKAELEEIRSLEELGVLKWVRMDSLPEGAKLLKNKIVYKSKPGMPGVPGRRKCRLVACGYMERPHEYGDTFAQVVRHETVRCFFAAAAQEDSCLRSVDICSAFLTSPINRTVYMRAPEGFERPGYCIQLGASIYGTADAPRAYHRDFDKYLARS